MLADNCDGRIVGSLCLTFSGDREETWFDAEAICSALDGHLVAVVNETVQNEVTKLLEDNMITDQDIWLGAREVETRKWRWLDSK